MCTSVCTSVCAIARASRLGNSRSVHVLLLAYYFPPDGGPGCQRPLSFARHLASLGVRCTVVTRAIATHRGLFDPEDATLLEDLKAEVRVVRAQPCENWPELHAALITTACNAIAEERPDVILPTMSPFELWPIANQLSRQHDLPTICDLRDPWALDGVQDYRSIWHWWRDWRAMRSMLRRASGIIANTAESRTAILAAAPELNPARITHITNGWERDSFADTGTIVRPGIKLRLVHGGNFLCSELYARDRMLRRCLGWLRHRPEPIQASGRTPLHLLRVIRRLREAGEPAGNEVQLRVIGQDDPALHRCVQESGVADAVELCGYRCHHDLVHELQHADALFLTLHGLPNSRRARIVPGKTYEYLAAGRPILAGLPEGDARDLVATSPRAFLSKPCDEQVLAEQLVSLHQQWRDGAFDHAAVPPGLDAYERRHLTEQLRDFVAHILRQSSGTACSRTTQVSPLVHG